MISRSNRRLHQRFVATPLCYDGVRIGWLRSCIVLPLHLCLHPSHTHQSSHPTRDTRKFVAVLMIFNECADLFLKAS